MPTYPIAIQDKLDALQALTGADRKPAEIVAIYWPDPAGTKIYASHPYTLLPGPISWWPDLADAIETHFGDPIDITLTLIPDGTPFIDLPRAASISDDSINLTFSDLDDEFSSLLMAYGEGIRVTVYGYWPAVDLLLSMWRGMLHQPKEMNREQVKITATAGWRAASMLVPKRPHATSCPFIFGAFFTTQAEIDYHAGCPYNVHIGGSIGVPGFTDCPRRVKADCVERLDTEVFWPAFETRPDPIANNQTSGPNLLARAIGNESNLNDPIRVIFGERHIKAANLLAFRNETDSNHPEDGFFAGLFEFGEGPMLALWEFRMMGELVGAEHFQLRLGALGQLPTDWSPEVNSYSGTAHGYGRIQGESDNATASDYSASVRALGHNEVRVYSDPETNVKGYTTNRAWCLLELVANARWGYGQDYPRFDIQSFIDAAEWCDEYVTLTDTNGNTFSGVRSTFNAEVTARAIQQQVKDICTAGRLGIPFEFEGKDVVVPLKAEDVDNPGIPSFTDEGPNRNIIYDGVKSSLSWSVVSDEEMTNQWTVNFDEAANGGVDTQFIFGDQPQQLRAGRAWGDRSKRVINKSQAGYGINSAQEAARFGTSLLYLGPLDSGGILNPFSVKFTTWYSEAFNVQNYKLIKVTNAKLQSRMTAYFTARGLEPYPDADFTCFRVMKYTRKGDLRVEIEAQQYATLDIVASEPPVASGYVYFCDFFGGETGPIFSRVPKDDFTTAAIESFEITNPAAFMDANFGSMAQDDDYVYMCHTNPTYVHRYSKSDWGTYDFVQIGTVVNDETRGFGSSRCTTAIAVDTNYIYAAFSTGNSASDTVRLHRLHKSDFSTQDILVLSSLGGGAFNITQDDSFVYVLDSGNFSPHTNDVVFKVDKATFSVVTSCDLGTDSEVIASAGHMDGDVSLLYIGSYFINGITTLSKSTMVGPTPHGFGITVTNVMIDTTDSSKLWVILATGTESIGIVDKPSLTLLQTIALSDETVDAIVLSQDDDYVYVLQGETSPDRTITRISKGDHTKTELLIPGEFVYSMIAERTGGGTSTLPFGPPRDFIAVVNPTTGSVHFTWAPPLSHPELVTGYEMRDEFNDVVMPTDLVYALTTTLPPGTYTYKVRATNSMIFSGYTMVTFTVPEPPITGADLFVIDDLTLENVLDDVTLEQVTV